MEVVAKTAWMIDDKTHTHWSLLGVVDGYIRGVDDDNNVVVAYYNSCTHDGLDMQNYCCCCFDPSATKCESMLSLSLQIQFSLNNKIHISMLSQIFIL